MLIDYKWYHLHGIDVIHLWFNLNNKFMTMNTKLNISILPFLKVDIGSYFPKNYRIKYWFK